MKRFLITLAIVCGFAVPVLADTSPPSDVPITITAGIAADPTGSTQSYPVVTNILTQVMRGLNLPLHNVKGSAGTVQYGAFYRAGGTSPYSAGATSGASTAPSPYPSYNAAPGDPVAVATYCYGPDSAGNSIDSANPLDKTKLGNLLDLGVSWVRMDTNPYFSDNSQQFGNGAAGFSYGTNDSVMCSMFEHHIMPVISMEIGPVQYNDSNGGYTPVEHNRYDTPTAFVSYCTNIASHAVKVFGYGQQYSIPGNEMNGNAGGTDGIAQLTGSPPPPVPIPSTTAGTLTVGTSYNYKVTAIVNGVETLPSAPYYSGQPATTGHQSMAITWGPVAAETGGYKLYGRTGGSYLLIATLGHGVTSYTDTGSVTPTGAAPSTSTVSQYAMESDFAAYMKPCYQAIKTIDPTSFIWGLEMTESPLISTPAQFVTDLNTLFTCGPNTCYDGISTHLYPTFPVNNSQTCIADTGTGGYGLTCLSDLESALPSPVPMMMGETAITVPGNSATEAIGATNLTAWFNALASYKYMRYVNYANIDECALYSSGYFVDGCLVTTGNVKQLRWQTAKTFFNQNVLKVP